MSQVVDDVGALADLIRDRAARHSRFVVAISGFGGSGKTTVSKQLSTLMAATLIHVDDFIAADEHGAKEGFLHDWEKLESLTLRQLRARNEVVSRIYDWPTNRQILEWVPIDRHVIVEGSAGLIRGEYRDYFDLTVWLDVPAEIAHARGKLRDKIEQQVNHDDLWDNVWGPLELQSFEQLRPDRNADVLLANRSKP